MTTPLTLGLSRLAYQFKNSEKLNSFLESFLLEYDELQISGLQLLNERYLDTAVGVQLDGIGEIVGIARPLVPIDVIGAFGFLNDPTALGFGTLIDSDVGGNFITVGALTQLIGDDLYRLLLRAKAIENTIAMTVEETLALIAFVFSGVSIRYIQTSTLETTYVINSLLSPFEANLVSDFPVLIGIDTVEYRMVTDATPFGFSDDASAYGFGTLADPNKGGNFATIIT